MSVAAEAFIAKRVALSLERDHASAARVDLEVTVPPSLALRIEDGSGSGSVKFSGIEGSVEQDD